MELWVRSQDKERLMKINGLDYVEYNDKHVINGYGTNECDNYDLGIYSSKERALEVLDEIQQHINIMLSINILPESYVKTICDFVYEMPKE